MSSVPPKGGSKYKAPPFRGSCRRATEGAPVLKLLQGLSLGTASRPGALIPRSGYFPLKGEAISQLHAPHKTKNHLKNQVIFLFKYINNHLLIASAVATATATVAPTMGLLPMPRKPIISTCAGTEEEPANCASECIRPMVSVMP